MLVKFELEELIGTVEGKISAESSSDEVEKINEFLLIIDAASKIET